MEKESWVTSNGRETAYFNENEIAPNFVVNDSPLNSAPPASPILSRKDRRLETFMSSKESQTLLITGKIVCHSEIQFIKVDNTLWKVDCTGKSSRSAYGLIHDQSTTI